MTLNPSETPQKIRIDSLRLQLILVACLEYCFDRTASGGTVNLQSKRTKNGIAFKCLMEPDSKSMENIDEIPHRFKELQETLNHINAQLVPTKGSEQQGLEFILPLDA